MMAYASMLVDAAERAGIKTPPDDTLDDASYDKAKYPHFYVFCTAQLGCPMHPGEHWENAKAIASIPNEEITSVTVAQLKDYGYATKAR